jgi:hypothetical protein
MTTVAALNRTLEQELFTLLRGASLECLICGEFVQHVHGIVTCPECGADFGPGAAEPGLQFTVQAG